MKKLDFESRCWISPLQLEFGVNVEQNVYNVPSTMIIVLIFLIPCRCELLTLEDGKSYCEWNYNGLGFEYQLLAGPAFIAVYSIVGIFFGMAADKFNR